MKLKSILLALLCSPLILLTSCEQKSDLEKAADDIGDAAEEVADELGDAARNAE